MSTFRALNVESDNESEDEVDNTKEIQIEEALKLYQTALKYHSEGPQSFAKAAEAYQALFESEIFKYNESLSEFRRHELFGDTLVFDSVLQDEFEAGPVPLAGGNESAPNTLPQILHLAYKNHGQFTLEMMQHWMQEHGATPEQHLQNSEHVLSALTNFGDALDKEDADLDLWLRAASVAALLGSKRITRFCLEAVLDGDDEMLDSILRLPGLEEGFAGQQLRDLVQNMEDDLSLMLSPLSSMRRKKLSEALKRRLNPCPFAPLPSEVTKPAISALISKPAERIPLIPTKWDWAGVGEAILHRFIAEQSGFIETPAGSAIGFAIPPDTAAEVRVVDNVITPPEQMLPEPPQEDRRVQVAEPVVSTTEPEVTTARNDDGDVVMEEGEAVTITNVEEKRSATPQDRPNPLSRKRSTDSAGLPETAEGGRSRSKRIRARDTVPELNAGADTVGPDLAKQLEDQLYTFSHADECLFEIVNDAFVRLGVHAMSSPKQLRDFVSKAQYDISSNDIDKVASDMYSGIQSGGQKVAAVLLSNEVVDLGGMSREAGMNAFLGHAKSNSSQTCAKPLLVSESLGTFAHTMNHEWMSIKEVAFAWLEMLLAPGTLTIPALGVQPSGSSYMQHRWGDDLKRHLVQIIVNFDEYFYEELLKRVGRLDHRILTSHARSKSYELSEWDRSQIEMVQSLFEIHLDIYSLIKHPHSGVDVVTQTTQSDRLERWCSLARDALQLRSDCDSATALDELAVRHMWASVFLMSVSDHIEQEQIIATMEELKAVIQAFDGHIEVQNNAVMPELSIAAIDRELARIGMKDFFLRVFDQDEKDPVAVIESLEPVLEYFPEESEETMTVAPDLANPGSSETVGQPPEISSEVQLSQQSPSQEMKRFLDTATGPLRLSLWQRLREAYEKINYPPKVVSCYLRSVESLMSEFKTSNYKDSSLAERHIRLMTRLRIIDEILVKVLLIIKDEKTALDCLTFEHLQASMTAIAELLRIMSAANFFEDLIRVGQVPVPRFEGCPPSTFNNMTIKLHDMQLRAWMLQYHLLKEGVLQAPGEFPTPSEDQFEFIRHVHYATGVRHFCHAAGRLFLRLAKDEILRLDDVIDGNTRDTELAQVLYDLYGLKVFVNPQECHENNSSPEILDKKVASQLLPFIMSQANKINIKDLPKTDVKVTIEKVHGALGRPKTNEDISLNRKLLTSYFKSPINPISLFNCIKGIGSLSTKHIPVHCATIASLGWYFLMGNIALSKFRTQKRLTQGPTEDLNFAQAFFLQDLEFSVERWETWYRLAQANDSLLEEAVSWNADKLNGNHAELIHLQRAAIHCYVLAVACAVRNADLASQTAKKISEMYTDFGNRVYASSREPFNMAAFAVRDTEHKFYSGYTSQKVYSNAPFIPLEPFTAWKFSSVLFKRAIEGDPDRWWNHYMLGKCLWKMYCFNADRIQLFQASGEQVPAVYLRGPSWEQVINAFANAVETLPEKKERQQPILEPHYKLVSIAYKLHQRKAIDYAKGAEILQHTPYAQNVRTPDSEDDWEGFIINILKALRAADKQSWHHRIILRSAHVVYDENPNEPMTPYAARHELTSHIFTKTMTVQVWKPENERPGRHFVYTTRYTRFLIQLLAQMGDKTTMDILAKKVRRKTSDFFEHTKLWQDLCAQYLRILRRYGKIPDGQEDSVFKALNVEDFQVHAARMEVWCQSPTSQHPALEVLRETIELKRINNGLMKPLLIDDLIGDTYALLYATVGPTLAPLPSEQQQPPHPIEQQPGVPPVQQPLDPMALSSLTHVQSDGAGEHPQANTPFNIYHPSQLTGTAPAPNPTLKPEAAPKSRIKTVGRREIQRKAEGAVSKVLLPSFSTATPATVSTSTVMPIRSPVLTQHPPIIASLPGSRSPEKEDKDKPSAATTMVEQLQVPTSGTATATGSVAALDFSAPGSLHDDADDESELSELDEREVQEIGEQTIEERRGSRRMFPNLGGIREVVEETEEDDEEEEEEDEGEGDGDVDMEEGNEEEK